MTVTTSEAPETKAVAVAGIPFTVASRPQRRFSNTQTANVLNGATSFAPIPLPATGLVRKISLMFRASVTSASAGAVVAGDGPFNLISGISLTDATGQPITQPISGYNLYLVNKYLGGDNTIHRDPFNNPAIGPEYAYSSTSTTGTATFRLDLDLEQDAFTGYGCIPNLDANASLQLKIDLNPYSVAFSGTTVSAATVSVVVDQHYWAPIGAMTGGVPNAQYPPGYGDFVETRYETQTVTASAENTIPVNNRGGLIKGIILVSRAAGVRTAFTAGSNVGLVYDNNAVDEGIRLDSWQDDLRRMYGYIGADVGTSYAPITAGTLPGLDNGVIVVPFLKEHAKRDAWLSTRVGTLLQVKATPGASATQMELITQLGQVNDAAAFYAR